MVLSLISEFIVHAIEFPGWLKPEILKIGPIAIRWYGLGYILGLGFAFYYAVRCVQNARLWKTPHANAQPALVPNRKMLEDFMFLCFFGIVLGGRVGFIILYDLQSYLQNPIEILKVWKGGMAFHGGFLGVCIAAIYFAKTRKLRLWRAADMAAIGAPIGLGLVRLANFINQELVGRPTDMPWGVKFDYFPQPRHPSQLYEAFLEGFVIFMVIFIAARRFGALTRPGLSSGLCIGLYGVFRIFVEFFRVPDAPLFGPLTRGMTYSIPMVIVGAALVIWALRQPATAPLYPPDPSEDANA